MSTKQYALSLGSILLLALLASPCAAQIIYVRDAAGYVRPVVIPSSTTFSMGMQVQAVVGGDGTFVRVNVTPTAFSIMDPTTIVPLLVPGPNLGIFDDGKPQPSFISLKPNVMVLGAQGGQQGMFGQGGFAGQSMFGQGSFTGQSMFASNPFGQVQSNVFAMTSMQSNSSWPMPQPQTGAWPLINPNLAIRLQAGALNPMFQRNPYAGTWPRSLGR